MTMIHLTLNATTEKQEIANFVYAILAQFKNNPNVMLQVHINDEPWVARDFIGGLYLTVGTVEQYQENKAAYEDLISEDITSPLYEHNPSVMEFNELVDALTRLAAKY